MCKISGVSAYIAGKIYDQADRGKDCAESRGFPGPSILDDPSAGEGGARNPGPVSEGDAGKGSFNTAGYFSGRL